MAYINKSSSFVFISSLLLSLIALPFSACHTPPPPPSYTTHYPSPPPPHMTSPALAPMSASPPILSASPPSTGSCPIDTLRLGVCAELLGLVDVLIGTRAPGSGCCTLLNGLVDLDAAVCLCTAIKANVLGINLNIPVSLRLLLNACDKTLPSGYTCQ